MQNLNGWKSPIRNETFEKLASMSLIANMTVYLSTQYNMDGLAAVSVVNVWGGTCNFITLLGAFISDAYLGRFRTLLYASFTYLLINPLCEYTLYDNPSTDPLARKLRLTDRFTCLTKAAVITELDQFNSQGLPVNGWRLCSVQQVEQFKCILSVLPVWASGITCFVAMEQQSTQGILQAIQMDTRFIRDFHIPPGSMGISSMLALSIWVPTYERFLLPLSRKMTKDGRGITLRHRLGAGIVMSILCMMVAGVVEGKRRAVALKHKTFISPMSFAWLLPQFILSGMTEAFTGIGIMEFLGKQFPASMRTLAGSLFFISLATASYLSSFLVNLVHETTKSSRDGNPGWLGGRDLNKNKLDYYYYIVAGICVVNLIYFITFANRGWNFKKKKMVEGNKTFNYSSSPFRWIFCVTKCFPSPSTTKKQVDDDEDDSNVTKDSNTTQRKPAGWKSMPYVLGNETFERLAAFGLLANFMVYLLTQFHMDQVFATNVINIWSGTTNFAPLIGAFISDAYLGRFKTLAYASFMSFTGMVVLTLTAVIPNLRPPPCATQELLHGQCIGPNKGQLGVLFMALGFLTIGAGGIRPCSIPFGVDQFDQTTDEGRKGINSFFNWYYFTFTMVIMISLTLIVYIQDSVSWVLGLGIPTSLMFCSIVLFFVGTRIYVYIQPEGSVFSSIAQVFVAAYKKRKVALPSLEDGELEGVLYDPPMKENIIFKIPLTNQFRCLTKAAIRDDGELKPDGSPINKWRLCSIQQIEEVKCLIRTAPIWASGIMCFTSIVQQHTFTVSQALKMDRHLGPKFQIPAGSLSVIAMITLGLWIPFYDRILVPNLKKITKQEGGITLLQRMGIGLVFSILSMIVAGLIEEKRRVSAIFAARPDEIAPITVMWLAPQLILMGLAEAFNIIGQIEFYNKEFPEKLRTVGNSLLFCSIGGANYLSSFLVAIVHHYTRNDGHHDWLDNNINIGRVDYFYFLIAGLGVLNMIYFLVCAHRYRYKGSVDDMPIKLLVV
ncbi:Proton-dependent oligopeptide transporter family [Macleaya cordata]|uniref:Proton-dependent oligopeptide transporter family n=1 Tax=Macleaya cordata TaxID=56857 RepID=A0A200PQ29_MACCD|nr:Proton-dependent oligopeptide transporter family [Macleaya cordata]